jgi:hypothetical protein
LVGGLLLALLFALDAFLPKVPVTEKAKANSPLIRICSDRKWPERIVYDTDAPTIVPTSIASTEVTVHGPEMIADASADAAEREAFAMLLPSSVEESQPSDKEVREPKMRHQRKIAGNASGRTGSQWRATCNLAGLARTSGERSICPEAMFFALKVQIRQSRAV